MKLTRLGVIVVTAGIVAVSFSVNYLWSSLFDGATSATVGSMTVLSAAHDDIDDAIENGTVFYDPAATSKNMSSAPLLLDGAGCYGMDELAVTGFRLVVCGDMPLQQMGPLMVQGYATVTVSRSVPAGNVQLSIVGNASNDGDSRCAATDDLTDRLDRGLTSFKLVCGGFEPGQAAEFRFVATLAVNGQVVISRQIGFITDAGVLS